jgi:putative restriction endonuclease
MDDQEIRLKLFSWLNEKSLLNGGVFLRGELESGFKINGNVITLVGPPGIWIPAGFEIPISITTTASGPYDDGFTDEGILNYRYRGTDQNHRDNVGLREAMKQNIPLVYFRSIKPGKYVSVWPVFVLEDVRSELFVRVAIDPAYTMSGELNMPNLLTESNPETKSGVRRYITVITKLRLHQIAFREYVLDAYSRSCTLCNLQHVELLDAAHIIPDKEEGGEPIVPNGLSLCKIHHAAYDSNIIGISPDYLVKVREDVLEEIDGPMLKYGLQAMEGSKIILPKHKSNYPDKDRLDRRYRRFLSA